MKELTDKVNMDNLSLIIKTLRSKATSSTFFNKSNTRLLLKLAVAFYQFKDKSFEELIFTDAKYDESGCHDSFLDDLIKCINSDEIKNSDNQYVKDFLEWLGAKNTDDKDSSYHLTLNSESLNKLGISIYDSYPYTELKANLCSFINKLNIEQLKDSVQDTPSANGFRY